MPTKLYYDGGGVITPALTAFGNTPGTFDAIDAHATASATQVQFDDALGAGGALIEFPSSIVRGFTLSGAINFGLRARESVNTVNAGLRARVYRLREGVYTEVSGGPFDDGVELGTTYADMLWTGTPSAALTFFTGDMIVVRLYITNIGTMAAGTVFAAGAAGSPNNILSITTNFVEFTETILFPEGVNFGKGTLLGVGL